MVTRWLTNGRYYQLNLVDSDHKNPEYRIAEDLRIATDSPVDFIAGVSSALLSAATFIVVLWTIGGALAVTVAGSTIAIPSFLVIAAVLCAAIASSSIMVIGRRFVQFSEDKNQAEAEFRHTLTRVRENGESIALLGGEQEERDGIDKTFTDRVRAMARLARQHMRTTLVSRASCRKRPSSASRIAWSWRLSIAARSCWNAARVAPSLSATSTSFRATASGGCSAASCVSARRHKTRRRRRRRRKTSSSSLRKQGPITTGRGW